MNKLLKYAAAQGYGVQGCDATKASYIFFRQAQKKIKAPLLVIDLDKL